jgi:hypothetical protein
MRRKISWSFGLTMRENCGPACRFIEQMTPPFHLMSCKARFAPWRRCFVLYNQDSLILTFRNLRRSHPSTVRFVLLFLGSGLTVNAADIGYTWTWVMICARTASEHKLHTKGREVLIHMRFKFSPEFQLLNEVYLKGGYLYCKL